MRAVLVGLAWVVLGLLAALVAYRAQRYRKRRRRRQSGFCWSIGYQRSSDPFRWDPATAGVYTRHDAGPEVSGLADPFLVRHERGIFLFCEVLTRGSSRARIGVSLYDAAHDAWQYQGIALDESFHLSYPYVFRHGSEFYMIPETKQTRSVRLYRATGFPLEWKLERVLIDNRKLVDASIAFRDGRCYLFASRKRRLDLYVARELTGPWTLHPKSPLRRWNYARGAGRIIEHRGDLYRFGQEQAKGYGHGVHAFRILELSDGDYREEPLAANPLLAPVGDGWACAAMHHIDVLKLGDEEYFAVFDGQGRIGA